MFIRSSKVLVIFGTRPEAIKLFPVIHTLKNEADFNVTVCVTAQHREMLDQVLQVAQIRPDVDLDIMRPNQTLPQITSRILQSFDDVLTDVAPDRVMVQGDTTTAMAAALSSYYRKIPVDHVEAGLRSGDIYSPWPEEVNRKVVGALASLHFAPTVRAAESLIRENVPRDRIFVTGNTVIDALLQTKSKIDQYVGDQGSFDSDLPAIGDNRQIVLVTAHRRETSIGFAMGLIVATTYFLFVIVGDTLRGNPHAHPELLVWFPNVLFIFIGAILFRRLSKQ